MISSIPRHVWVIGVAAAGVIILIITAAFFAPLLRTQLLRPGAEAPPAAAPIGPAEILTGKVLVRAPQGLAVKLRAALEGTVTPVPTPTPAPIPTETAPPTESPTPTPSDTPTPEPTPEPTPSASPEPTPTASPEASPEASPTPTPPEGGGSVQGAAVRRGRVLAVTSVPELSSLGDLITYISPVVPLPPALAGAARELADVDRWFAIDLPGPEFSIAGEGEDETTTVQGRLVEGRYVPVPDGEAASVRGVLQRSDEDQKAKEELEAAVGRLQESQLFDAVEPVFVMQTAMVPDDPAFARTGSWGQPYDDLWGLKRIQAPAAWDLVTGSENVTVAVVDTGIDLSHPDLQGNIWENPGETGADSQGRDKRLNAVDDDGNGYVDDWRGWDFANNDNDPTDDHGHGTHVAGTIAAVGNNGTDVVGVMWRARLLAAKFLSQSGSGDSEDGAAALVYTARSGARVVNNSWSGPRASIIGDAVREAHRLGALVVAAAGNRALDLGDNPRSPASEPEAVAVSALTPSDARAGFSNYGEKIEFAAPGGEELRPLHHSILSLWTGGGTRRLAGTSMAAPHVSGAAGLLFARYPEWSNEQVRERLRQTAEDLGVAGKDQDFGNGVVNIAAAVDAQRAVTVALTAPRAAEFRREPDVSLEGRVAGGGATAYVLEHGAEGVPTTWERISGAPLPVQGGVIARWRGSPPPGDEQRTFRLTINPDSPERIQVLRRVVVSPTLRSGWPVSLAEYVGGFNGGENTSLLLADITGDGAHEALVGVAGFGNRRWPRVLAFDRHGRLLWQRTIAEYSTGVPALNSADLDADGRAEVLVGLTDFAVPSSQGNAVYVLKGGDGSNVPGWPQRVQSVQETLVGAPTAADLDGDGRPELLALAFPEPSWFIQEFPGGTIRWLEGYLNAARIYAWSADGRLVSGWPATARVADLVPASDMFWNDMPALAAWDVSGDRRSELFVALPRGRYHHVEGALRAFTRVAVSVYRVASDGAVSAGWPVEVAEPEDRTFSGGRLYGLAVGSVRWSQTPDLVVSTAFGRVAVLSSEDGALANGWPQDVRSPIGQPHQLYGPPLLADLDGNGLSEVFVGEHHALTGEGQNLPGWIADPDSGRYLTSLTYPPFAADVEGDGGPEILSDREGIGSRAVRAFQADGQGLPRWSKSDYAVWTSPSLVGDLDGDRKPALLMVGAVGSTLNLFAWDVQKEVGGAEAYWPSTHGDPAHLRVLPSRRPVSIERNAAATASREVVLWFPVSRVRGPVREVRLRNAGTAWSPWEPFAISKPWTLPAGDGKKVIEAQFRDAAGNESAVASDDILLGTPAVVAYYDASNGDLKYATNLGESWQRTTVDSAGDVGKFSAIARDGAAKAHISYRDETNKDLKYATNASGAWVAATVDAPGNVGQDTSVAVDASGNVHISYYDVGKKNLKYATNASGAWVAATVDAPGNVGEFSSIALDGSGKAHVSYYDATNKDLKYATNASGSWVAAAVDAPGNVGKFSSIAVDGPGRAHISYRDETNKDLKYATNVSGTWVKATVDSAGDVGQDTSIALDGAGKVHIAYRHVGNADLKYAASASGGWVTAVVDAAGNVGQYASITLDGDGKVRISYYDATKKDLKYATNASGGWVISAVDTAGNVGQYTSID